MSLKAKYPEGHWEDSGDVCPECGEETELFVVREEGIAYTKGERCNTCPWTTDFEEDVWNE